MEPQTLYTILLVVAAFIVGWMTSSRRRGAVETSFAEGHLEAESHFGYEEKSLELICEPSGDVTLVRHGLGPQLGGFEANIAITRNGYDISIEERLLPGDIPKGSCGLMPPLQARFTLKGLAHERYHLRYNSQATSCFAALSFRNRPGIHIEKPLTRA